MNAFVADGIRTAINDPVPAPPAAAPNILLVDDHPARLLTYEAILSGMPVNCVRANSGEEALQLLLKQSFALILLDVNMPGIDGYEVARYVRSHPRMGEIPIIFVSGERLTDLDRLKGYEVGAIDYISLPLVPEILRSKVAVLVELFHRRTELRKIANETRPATGLTTAHLRALFEHTSDVMCILRGERDAQGKLSIWRYVDLNESALALYGRTREELIGRTVLETFPSHAERAAMLCQQALQSGERLQLESEFASRKLLVRMFPLDAECVALVCTDITERKRAEQALATSEKRFHALLEGCSVGVAQCGMDGRFEYVNSGFCNLLGYSAEELARLTWQQITHPDDLAADQRRAELVLAGQLPHYTLEKRYIRKDGTPVWVSMFGNFIYDEQRRPIQGVAVAVDITARRIADMALLDSRQRLVLTHEAAGLGTFDWNIRQDTATWDTRARELWGLPPNAPFNLAVALAGIHPDDRATVSAALDRAMDGASDGRYFAIYRVIDARDGRVRWIESHGQAFCEGGKAVRMVGTVLDITERVDAENSLRESEERFRELANNIDQIVWTSDSAGQPTWYNDRWYEYSGASVEDMRSEGWSGLVHPAHVERVVQRYRDCIAHGETWEETFPVRGRNGEYRWFLSRAQPIKAADGTVLRWFGSNTDVTTQLELQQALSRSHRRKDEFLAILAHELRNPVAPIMNVARLLGTKLRDDAESASLVAIVDRQARNLARLLDDLLDVARITRDRLELRRETVDIRECVAHAVEIVEPMLRAGNYGLEVVHEGGTCLVDADKMRIGQCVTNLLSNAAKYSEPGSPITVMTRADDAHVFIEVRDSGRGIEAEFLPQLFELFSRGARQPPRASGGLGIGLAVCKRLIEMHGGAVTAHSEGAGRGCTFVLSLPRAAHERPPADRTVAAPAAQRRLLIVDDNRDAADSLAILMQMSGHEVRTLYRGEDVLAAVTARAPDAVILDIGLPGIDGREVMRQLRNAGFDGYAIALSGYGLAEDRRKSKEAGFDLHLVKPVEITALERAIEQVPLGASAQ